MKKKQVYYLRKSKENIEILSQDLAQNMERFTNLRVILAQGPC